MATAKTRAPLKGVYRLNPTKMIFKQGSKEFKNVTSRNVPGFKKVKPPKAIKGKTK